MRSTNGLVPLLEMGHLVLTEPQVGYSPQHLHKASYLHNHVLRLQPGVQNTLKFDSFVSWVEHIHSALCGGGLGEVLK